MEGKADPSEFRAYVHFTPEHAEALAYIDGLRMLLREIQITGLTPAEMKLSTNAILEPIRPRNMQPVQLEQIIETGSAT